MNVVVTRLRNETQRKHEEVAAEPERDFHFHTWTGRRA